MAWHGFARGAVLLIASVGPLRKASSNQLFYLERKALVTGDALLL
jgi:hypothetical protein